MGKQEFNVAVELKISVQDDSDLPKVSKGLGTLSHVKIQSVEEKDIGFGIKAIQAIILMQDGEGGVDLLEENIRKIDGVSEVDIQNVTRLI